jgi:hypothetical protein
VKGRHQEPLCEQCDRPLRIRKSARYEYVECGLDNVVLLGVEVRECKVCKTASAAIPQMSMLHTAIASIVADQSAPLDASQFFFLAKYLRRSEFQAILRLADFVCDRPYDYRSAPLSHEYRWIAEPGLRLATYVEVAEHLQRSGRHGSLAATLLRKDSVELMMKRLTVNRQKERSLRRTIRIRFDARKAQWFW